MAETTDVARTHPGKVPVPGPTGDAGEPGAVFLSQGQLVLRRFLRHRAAMTSLTIFVLSWLAPEVWFQWFHHLQPVGLDVALLRRAGGQWAAFAAVQAITLWRWRAQPAF